MKNAEKDWLKVNKMCREIKWLIYDPDYKDINLKKALEILEQLKEKLAGEIDK
tara:strand:- start:3236 stop:3394 length:159 start_codon:yes stop_codon:yes gene_type:complete